MKFKLLILALLLSSSIQAQDLEIKWKFKTEDKVLAPPLISGQDIYVGSEDGNFYSINAKTAEEQWRFKTRGRIIGKATSYMSIVIFESGNMFFALDKSTGREIWRFDPGSALWGYKIDPWDDKRSSGVVHKGIFYAGSSLGGVIGLDVKAGERKLVIPSEFGSPIRTTPMINGTTLYFGDWAGKVYAYDLSKSKMLWKKKTYDEKLYDSFGGIVSEIKPYEGKLIFGARNHNLQVLDQSNGDQVWTYADSTGGWIIGDPVIQNNTLYMGGSDNLSMYAFDPDNGELKWKFKAGQNIYTKPVISGDHLLFTTGNGYNANDPGNLFMVNKETGELMTQLELPKGVFSSPALLGSTVYFGCHDGYLYAVDLN